MGGKRTRTIVAAALCLTAILSLPAFAGWSAAANLPLERAGHAAVVLPNGKVLVTGGCWAWKDSFTAACELYDPASNTWSATGNMTSPRSEHGLVLLANGKVLAIGGFYKDGENEYYLGSCDLYDPASGTWAPTGPLAVTRTVFATVLLSDGKVLVAGGLNKNPEGQDQYLADAEIYDPASGTWTTAASLAQSRSAHTGTLLPNGKVLIAGGASGFTALTAAEEYNPALNTWASAGSTSTAHAGHSATLLQNGKVLVAAGASGFSTTGVSEIYDPVAHTWTTTGSLVEDRALHTATLLTSGKVLVAGGQQGFPDLKNAISHAEIYNPATGAWSATDPMVKTREIYTANLLSNGSVLVVGGLFYDGTTFYARKACEIYTPDAGGCALTCSASATPTSGIAPLSVQFTGSATATGCSGSPAYAWTFGDGASSTEQSPSHTFSSAGTFDWTLTVTADDQTCTQSGTITVTPPAGGKPGDCDANGTVTIGEVQKAINMFLGTQAVGCGADCNGDGSISIGEVQKVINAFLGVASTC